VVRIVHRGTFDGGGGLLLVIVTGSFVVYVGWMILLNVGRVTTTRFRRRPLHVSMMVGMGTHLLLDVLWSNAFSVLVLAFTAGVFSDYFGALLGHVQLNRNWGTSPARRARLGAGGCGGGTTRIP
jgi:hypothetical protein